MITFTTLFDHGLEEGSIVTMHGGQQYRVCAVLDSTTVIIERLPWWRRAWAWLLEHLPRRRGHA